MSPPQLTGATRTDERPTSLWPTEKEKRRRIQRSPVRNELATSWAALDECHFLLMLHLPGPAAAKQTAKAAAH